MHKKELDYKTIGTSIEFKGQMNKRPRLNVFIYDSMLLNSALGSVGDGDENIDADESDKDSFLVYALGV